MCKLWKRILAATLTVALLFSSVPAQAFAASVSGEEADSETVATAETVTDEPFVVGELTEKRDVNVKHFRMSDGSIMACVYPEPVHYLDNGAYKQIDNSLVTKTSANGKKHYVNKAGAFQVKLPEGINDDYIEFSDDNGYVKFRLLGATNKSLEKHADTNSKKSNKTQVENTSSKSYYKAIKQNVDLSYEITPGGLKETIILNKKTKENFVFEIQTSAARAEAQEDGSVIFYDDANTVIYTMASPFMVDAAGAYTSQVAVTLQKSETGYLMEYAPDEEWLWDKSRQYPVQLDPTLKPTTNALSVRDTYVFNEQSATNPPIRGYMDLINIGRRTETTSSGEQMILRGFFYFDNPVKLAETDCLISAKLTMIHNYAYSSVDGTQINLYALNAGFEEGSTHWHNQPSYDPELIDYAIVDTDNMLTSTKSCDVYDITKLVQAWNDGAENHGLAFVLNNEGDQVSSTQQVYYFAKDNAYHGATAQFVSITYKDTRGLESYWNYTTQDLGASGTGYVNNYNGGLTYTHTDAVNDTNHTAFDISHVYNAVNRGTDTGFGNGWTLSLCQTLEPVTMDIDTDVKYVYTDGDGTQHYLIDTEGSIKDEDGLGYTYESISGESGIMGKLTDKSGKVLKFDTRYHLTQILDPNGNSIDIQFAQNGSSDDYRISAVETSSGERYTLSYDAAYRLTQITDNAGRNTKFEYSGNNLTKITYPDGTYTTFAYDSASTALSAVTHSEGYGTRYTYAGGKVSSAAAVGKNNADAGTTYFSYQHNQTKVTDPLGHYNVFQFDNAGHVTGVYNDLGQTCAQAFTTASHSASEIFKNNKVTSATGVTAYSKNLLKNGTFLNGLTGWTTSGSVTSVDEPYISAKSIKLTASSGNATVSQNVTTASGGAYTLAAYIRVDSLSSPDGFCLSATTNRRTLTPDSLALAPTNPDVDSGFRRVSFTMTLDEGEQITAVTCGLKSATGIIYVNAIQLEQGASLGNVNLITNSGFDSGTDGWTSTGSGNKVEDFSNSDREAWDGSAFLVSGDTTQDRNVCQTLAQGGKEGDVYTFGGWASLQSLPDNHEDHPAKMMLEVTCADGSTETVDAPFNVTLENTWQCVSQTFVAEDDYTGIKVYFCYNKNANSGCVDDVFLYRDTVQSYTYDSNGNVISTADKANQESSFQYSDNSLSKLIQPTGEHFSYRYDDNKNMIYALSGSGLGYAVQYDSYGNAVESTIRADWGNAIQNGKVYCIRNRSTGTYITAADPELKNLSDVVLSSNTSSDLMKFRAILVPEGYYVLRPIGSEEAVLSYRSRYEENSPAEIDTVEANDTSTDWTHLKIVLADLTAGSYNIIARMAQKGGYFTVSGGDVCLDYEDDSAAQEWYFIEVEEDGTLASQNRKPFTSGNTYYLRNVESGQYLSVSGSVVHTADVVQNVQGDCVQTWTAKKLSNGYIIFRPAGYSSFALTYLSRAEAYSGVDVESTGANVETKDWSYWLLHPLEDGSGAYRISAPAVTEYGTATDHLAVADSSHAPGDNVRMEAYTGLDSQKWVLVDASGEKIVTSAAYTSNGAYVDTVTDALGNTTNYDYDPSTGLLQKVTDAKGNSTSYTYNESNGNLTKVTSGSSTASYTYYADGALKTITSPSGTVYTFTYDALGRTTDIRVGSQSLSTTVYDDDYTTLPESVTYGNGSQRTYRYDANQRLTAELVNGTPITAYTYDKLGRLIRFEDLASGVAWEFSYDLIGRTTGIYASDGRYVGYTYDSFNRIEETVEYVGGMTLATGYRYDDQSNHSYKTGLFRGIFLNNTRQLAYSYDDMGRRDKRVLMTASPFVTEYTYHAGAAAGTTSTVVKTVKNGNTTWEYAYDALGNITSIKKNGTLVERYAYDSLSQLKSVVRGSDTYAYAYDAGGNLLSVTKNGTVVQSYTYGHDKWKDLLTAYNGQTITYDAIGNPLSYYNGTRWSFTWENGRSLATASGNGKNISYTYDASGLRTSKTVGGTRTDYYWLGDTLQAQKTGDEYLIFLYDENGTPYGFIQKNGSTETYYYYIFNLQGDVIGILNASGTEVATYTYDAWGNILSITGDAIGQTNPLRYRGYYYDSETGLYYVSSRYYDPEIGRWINTDNRLSGVGGEVLGYNMFAYCMNNPVNMSDSTGNWPSWATKLVAAVAVVAVLAVVATVCVATCGAGSVVAAAAVGAAKGAAIGLATGAASGAAIGYATTGTLEGTLNGMADGALSGAISGAISGGISGGAKAAAQSSSRVLWSGGDAAKNTAASYAKSIGGTTLEQTPKGKLLTGLTNIFGYDKTASLWQQASVEFASGARGNVTAIVSRSGYRGAGSILSRFEYPMVASRIIDGLVDSFNVILIG